MAQISAINPTDAALTSARVPSQFSSMSTEDFIKIIFTELSNQDPFQPNDSAALLQQLNSIRSIESDLKLTTQLQSLVQENQLASASNMIGKFIGGLTQDNNRVAGYVVSVIRVDKSVHLELDNGWIVPISGVETVIDPAMLEEAPPILPPPSSTPDDDDDNGNGDIPKDQIPDS